LPSLIRYFKNYFKHKQKKITLKDLIVHLRIEEDNKAVEKKTRVSLTIAGVNIVKEGPNIKKRKKMSKPKCYCNTPLMERARIRKNHFWKE